MQYTSPVEVGAVMGSVERAWTVPLAAAGTSLVGNDWTSSETTDIRSFLIALLLAFDQGTR
jgi:hypothetical protein